MLCLKQVTGLAEKLGLAGDDNEIDPVKTQMMFDELALLGWQKENEGHDKGTRRSKPMSFGERGTTAAVHH
jgi:hypothetical protein